MRWMPPHAGERQRLLLHLALLVPLGFAVKYATPGSWHHWGFSYGGAVLYEVFWVLAARFVRPSWSPLRCGMVVCSATAVLEMLQLWHPGWLESLRATFPGRILLGHHFDPVDFFYYLVGTAIGVGWLKWLIHNAAAEREHR